MNKKKVLILVVLICLFAAVAVVLGVVLSRSNDTPNGEETTDTTGHHTHEFGEWQIVKDATCTETGMNECVCVCGKKKAESIPMKDHVLDNDVPTISEDGDTATISGTCSVCGNQAEIEYSGAYLDGEDAYSFKDGKRQYISDEFLTYKGNTYYIVSDKIVKNYYIIDGKVYNFGNDGIMVDSVLDKVIVTVGQKQYYVVGNVVQKSGYANVNGQYYELGTDGAISQHSHSFVNGVCKCGATNGHTCADNNKDHKCDVCGKVISECSDINGDGKCDVCGATFVKKPSEGLAFTLNTDGKSYYVSGIGTCKNTDIVIPSEYNGKPVTSIGYGVFDDCTNLRSITISNGIKGIATCAFVYCTNLTSVIIPSSVTSIEFAAFSDCQKLTGITFDGTRAQWDKITARGWCQHCFSFPIHCTDGDVYS